MQHNKSTKKIEQIEKISQNEKGITDNIMSVMEKFGTKSVLTPFDVLKRSGALISTLAITLIILPFVAKDSIYGLFIDKNRKQKFEGQKDAYYEMKNNSKLNWRNLLYGMAKRFQLLVSKADEEIAGKLRAMILDDTTIEKTGISMEKAGYVHDHVSGRFILGYKILVLGYWDGVSFIPIDFSVHREKRDGKLKKAKKQLGKKDEQVNQLKSRKNQLVKKINGIKGDIAQLKKAIKEKAIKEKATKTKQKQLEAKKSSLENNMGRLSKIKQNIEDGVQESCSLWNKYHELQKHTGKCGLKEADYSKQYKKKRERGTAGHKRIKEVDSSKIDNSVLMIKRALGNRFKFEYVLTDSWFFCGKFLQFIASLGNSINLVSMAKINNAKYKILRSNKYLSPKQIIALNKRKAHTNRAYKAKYIKVQAEYQGVRVVIFLINIGKGENWRLLVSTDLNIGFNKLMQVYKIRWTIEVFFKEAKQYLLLGKSQSQDFDAQIADTTLSFIRYVLLSYYERIHYGTSIGGLFRKLSQASIEENIVADLTHVFMELLLAFADLAGIDFMTFYEELIRQPQHQESLKRLKILQYPQAA